MSSPVSVSSWGEKLKLIEERSTRSNFQCHEAVKILMHIITGLKLDGDLT